MKKNRLVFLLMFFMSVAFGHDYYPIAVGNEWTYAEGNSGNRMWLTIVSDTFLDGMHVYAINYHMRIRVGPGFADSFYDTASTCYLYSSNNDVFYNNGFSPDNWKMFLFKHSYVDGENWVGSWFLDYSDTLSAHYYGMNGLFDSCYNIKGAKSYDIIIGTAAVNIGPIYIGEFHLVDFHLYNSVAVQRKNLRFQPSNGIAVRLSDHLVPKIFTLNGRMIHSFFTSNPGAGFYILNYPASSGFNKKYAGKVILNR
jgi:hypothetical protein